MSGTTAFPQVAGQVASQWAIPGSGHLIGAAGIRCPTAFRHGHLILSPGRYPNRTGADRSEVQLAKRPERAHSRTCRAAQVERAQSHQLIQLRDES